MTVPSATPAVLLLFFLAPSGALPQRSAPDARQRQAVEDLERHWVAVEDDPAALDSVLADDFIHVLPAGFITKRQQLDFMRSHPGPKDPRSKRFEDLRVRLYGTAAIATGIVVATAPDGTVQKTIFTDVFANRRGRWPPGNAPEPPPSRPPSPSPPSPPPHP